MPVLPTCYRRIGGWPGKGDPHWQYDRLRVWTDWVEHVFADGSFTPANPSQLDFLTRYATSCVADGLWAVVPDAAEVPNA